MMLTNKCIDILFHDFNTQIFSHGSWRSTGSSEFIGAGSQSISFDSSSASDRLPVSQNASPNYSSASEGTPQAFSDSQHSSTAPSPNHQSVNNIDELIKKTQLVRQPGSKNLTPAQSLDHSGELGEGMPKPELPGSSENSSQNSNTDFIQILHDRHLDHDLIPSSQRPVNNLNLRIHTKENSSYSTSGSSNLSGSSNFRSSDMSFEHLDSCHISDASRCSVSSQNAVSSNMLH